MNNSGLSPEDKKADVPKTKIPWTLIASEFIGTALLIGIGVSFVILDFGHWLKTSKLRWQTLSL